MIARCLGGSHKPRVSQLSAQTNKQVNARVFLIPSYSNRMSHWPEIAPNEPKDETSKVMKMNYSASLCRCEPSEVAHLKARQLPFVDSASPITVVPVAQITSIIATLPNSSATHGLRGFVVSSPTATRKESRTRPTSQHHRLLAPSSFSVCGKGRTSLCNQ